MDASNTPMSCLPDLLAASSSESDSDDEFFDDVLLPAMLAMMKRRRLNRKRRAAKTTELQPKKRGGQVGRRWTQRKKGEIRPEMFGWLRLIAQPDVGDLKSKNGKVH